MLLDAHESQLVLVDYQTRLMPVIFEASLATANAVRLARLAKLVEVPVWGTEQNPERLGHNDGAVRESCDRSVTLLFDPEHNLEERILIEQFTA